MQREVTGKVNKAIIYTNVVEEEAINQIRTLCDQDFTAGSKIRIMPDVHAGAGCTIGTTMTITDKVVPNLVGVDIGCGMETICVKNSHIEVQKLDKLIYEKIPSGFNIRKTPHKFNDKVDLTKLKCLNKAGINLDKAVLSLGTLGGGNHFIEANQDEEGRIYIVIHSGSRHLGLETAAYYQNLAIFLLEKSQKFEEDKFIQELKQSGKEKEIQLILKEKKKLSKADIPKNLAYLSNTELEDYLHDMKLIQEYAKWNRKAMMDEIVKGMKLKVTDQFTTIHNYINLDDRILRKGAVSAKKGEKLLIPINMKDGSLICIGKGNEEWNESAPHGAGRLYSRRAAKNNFTVSEFKKQMKGIYTTSVSEQTLDECPMAYKSMADITENIKDTVEIINCIKPIYNYKSNGEG